MLKIIKLQLKLIALSLFGFFLLPFVPMSLDFHPIAYNVTLPEFTGALEQNNLLDRATELFKDKLAGPESLAMKDGFIYTGTQFGDIFRIDPVTESIKQIANTGSNCKGLYEEEKCGRVLGLRFDRNGSLYATDAYKGLLKIDIKTGSVETLVPNGAYVAESKLLFADDLDIDDNGVIYYSQGSIRWGLHQILYIVLEHDTTGRILTYDTKTKRSGVLVENLAFPNGVQLTKDRSALLFSELGNKRIMKYQLKGANKGKLSVFAENLPGGPDNIRLNSRGTYWVGIDIARSASKPDILDYIAPYPLLGEATIRLCWLIGQGIEFANQYINHPTLHDLSSDFTHAKILTKLVPTSGIVLELDQNGKILRSLHSTQHTLFSEVLEFKNKLYIGSFIKPYLLRLPIADA